mgnify:CR=1 FL=1
MSRNTPWLNETQPGGFCEISRELAEELGIANGEDVTVESVRGQITVTAIVTHRLQPLRIQGRQVHTVGLSWQFGWSNRKYGSYDSANLLSPSVGDPNTGIPETKCFMVNLKRA